MLSVIASGKICKAQPQLAGNTLLRNSSDIVQCVKQATCGAGFPDLASPAYSVADNFSFIRFPARYFMEVFQ
jgi:hypothetical protein